MIGGKKYVTINTDAGIHPSGKGAYAFWIKMDERTVKRSGVLKEIPIDSGQAEMMCIINAIHIAKKHREFFTSDVVVINTDSLAAIHAFTNQPHNVKQKYKTLRWAYIELTRGLKQDITFKHVKGHSKGDSPREYINNWCDKEVRKIYKSLIKNQHGTANRIT